MLTQSFEEKCNNGKRYLRKFNRSSGSLVRKPTVWGKYTADDTERNL